MKPSEFKIYISIENFDEELLKMTEMATLSKSAWLPSYQRYLFQILLANIEDLNKDCVNFTSLSFILSEK